MTMDVELSNFRNTLIVPEIQIINNKSALNIRKPYELLPTMLSTGHNIMYYLL